MRNERYFYKLFKPILKGGLLMAKTIVGVFNSQVDAEKAARQVKDDGLRTSDISIIAKQGDKTETDVYAAGNATGIATNPNASMGKNQINDNISDGVVTGGVLGGLAGLLIGAGTMVIPGLGIIAAAGPITGLLSGAVTGGIVGGLVDLGIPEAEGKRYENNVKQGKILWSMRTDENIADRVQSILKDCGATEVSVY